MFYEIFKELCNKNNTTPTAVLKELNVSPSKGTTWKNGADPSLKHLILISEYFGVTVDFLIGKTNSSNLFINGDNSVLIKGNAEHSNINNNIQAEQLCVSSDEKTSELLKIWHNLNAKSRTKLLSQAYEYEEEILNNNN